MLVFAYINIFGNLHQKLVTEFIYFGVGVKASRWEIDERENFVVFNFSLIKIQTMNIYYLFQK